MHAIEKLLLSGAVQQGPPCFPACPPVLRAVPWATLSSGAMPTFSLTACKRDNSWGRSSRHAVVR